jgi:hypothetical protein
LRELNTKLQFTSTFGINTKDKNAILGPYFYFTDFNNATHNILDIIDECEIINGNTKSIENYGVIRFAIFLGNIKVINDYNKQCYNKEKTTDTTDTTYYTDDTDIIVNYENWTKNYNSCYLGKIELDSGVILQNTPLYVVKEYCQQIPLNYMIYK